MRIVHTSDWHLGHTLHEVSREYEHARFLEWLLGVVRDERADALLVAGDVFDTANPSAAAQRSWYEFLTRLRAENPRLDVVVIGGNHDSADRLDAPGPLLRHGFGIHVVGGLPRQGREELVLPLHRADGSVGALVAAVPFLRAADLPVVEGEDPLVEGVRAVYDEVLAVARSKRQPGQALVAMGHLYLARTRLSELSERKILGGNQHALPPDLFGEDLAYVALGHLHLAQQVGRPSVRYSGSPLPLSMAEVDYPHQVLLVELEGEKLAGVKELRVPRAVELIRLPAMPLPDLLAALEALPPLEAGRPEHERPLLEARVRLSRPEPTLRARVDEALAGKAARLVKLGVEFGGDGRALAERVVDRMLAELQPTDVFANRWRSALGDEPPAEYLEAFCELLEAAQREEGGR